MEKQLAVEQRDEILEWFYEFMDGEMESTLFISNLHEYTAEDVQWEESEIQRCRCGNPMSYSRTLLMELDEHHWTCMECGWTKIEDNTAEDAGVRTMTPLENQWMDFKRVLSELVVFQSDYEERTGDKCPGNKYYQEKLMAIVNHAKEALNANAAEDEQVSIQCVYCGKSLGRYDKHWEGVPMRCVGGCANANTDDIEEGD